jgi:RND family efflux transporter MFP subunit
MRQTKPWFLLPIPVVLISAGLALHLHRLHQADASPPAQSTPWAVNSGVVGRQVLAARVQSVATVSAPETITLTPQVQGTVLAVGPRAGVAVKRGELLVRIDARAVRREIAALQQQRAAAQADAAYAARQRARLDAVLAEGGVSRAQAEQAAAADASAQAAVVALSDRIAALAVTRDQAQIRAPRDAVVAQRMVEVGDTAVPGRAVYRLTAGRGAVVRVSLPASQLARVRVGDAMHLTEDGASVLLAVSRIAPAVDAAGLGMVEADAARVPFGLPSGSTVAATLVLRSAGTAPVLSVPSAALVGSGRDAHVLLIEPPTQSDQAARLRVVPVTVLRRGADGAAVDGALRPGERLVVGQSGVLAQMRDGDFAIAAAASGAAR